MSAPEKLSLIQRIMKAVHTALDPFFLAKTTVELALAVGAAYAFFRKKLHSREAEIAFLESQLADAKTFGQRQFDELQKINSRLTEIQSKIPSSILERAQNEIEQNNEQLAQALVRTWFVDQGETLSRLFGIRATDTASRAAGDLRLSGLVLTRSYARASLAVDPTNVAMIQLAADANSELAATDEQIPGQHDAFVDFDKRAKSLFEADAVAMAEVLLNEVARAFDNARYRACLPMANLSRDLLIAHLGKTHPSSTRARQWRVRVLERLGLATNALEDSNILLEEMMRKPERTQTTLEMLELREFRADVLRDLGRPAEALSELDAVIAMLSELPTIGRDHKGTLGVRQKRAAILCISGRPQEALEETTAIIEAESRIEGYGPNHPNTYGSRYVRTIALHQLERLDEALVEIREIVAGYSSLDADGPPHPNTLAALDQMARILRGLERYEESLSVAQEVLKARASHLSMGPAHPDTLYTASLVADDLLDLGLFEESENLITSIIDAQSRDQSIGPDHRETRRNRITRTALYLNLGRREEAIRELRILAVPSEGTENDEETVAVAQKQLSILLDEDEHSQHPE